LIREAAQAVAARATIGRVEVRAAFGAPILCGVTQDQGISAGWTRRRITGPVAFRTRLLICIHVAQPRSTARANLISVFAQRRQNKRTHRPSSEGHGVDPPED